MFFTIFLLKLYSFFYLSLNRYYFFFFHRLPSIRFHRVPSNHSRSFFFNKYIFLKNMFFTSPWILIFCSYPISQSTLFPETDCGIREQAALLPAEPAANLRELNRRCTAPRRPPESTTRITSGNLNHSECVWRATNLLQLTTKIKN